MKVKGMLLISTNQRTQTQIFCMRTTSGKTQRTLNKITITLRCIRTKVMADLVMFIPWPDTTSYSCKKILIASQSPPLVFEKKKKLSNYHPQRTNGLPLDYYKWKRNQLCGIHFCCSNQQKHIEEKDTELPLVAQIPHFSSLTALINSKP